jgi:hypothetical protein
LLTSFAHEFCCRVSPTSFAAEFLSLFYFTSHSSIL